MDSGFSLLKFLFPQLPSLASTAVWYSIGRTPTSSKWDLRTEITVQILRQMMGGGGSKPKTIGVVQKSTLNDPGVKGKTWVAKATIEAPKPSDEGIREAVFKAIEDMKPIDAGDLTYTRPDLVDVEVEWTGYRPNAGKEQRLPDVSEKEKYVKMMSEPSRTSDTTILYFHGGAYYLCDPATHRMVCSRLAKESNGRVCSVRYRLAPQTAFPGQLLDALLVYLSLIYPPSGSMHAAVPSNKIVLVGDSAGGNLTFALLQLLLQLNRTPDFTVRFHGKDITIPLPAGAAANSGWFDISRSMPSIMENAPWDYLPTPNYDDPVSHLTQDSLWPTDPPRGDLFCDLSLLDHPLVSPVAAESWKGSPPLWLCTGQECLRDEDAILASQAAAEGVKVRFEEYEAMPHCFAMVLPHLQTAGRCMRSCGNFSKFCVEEPSSLKSSGLFVQAKTGNETLTKVHEASKIEFEEARRLIKASKDRRVAFSNKTENTMKKSTL